MASYFSFSPWFFSAFFSSFLILIILCKSDPTDGFTAVKLAETDFQVQSPYDLPQSDRYSFENGTRRMWVYSNDKRHDKNSKTEEPRTEIRMENHDYSSGVWQFEGHGYVPSGTTGVTIMQVFGKTLLQLHIRNGQLWYSDKQLIEDNIYERWFRLNVIHYVGENFMIYINGVMKFAVPALDHQGTQYFKFGVYMTRDGSSHCMESRWKDVNILQKT